MKTLPRNATEHDAAAVAALLGELGYPTSEADAGERIREALADPAACVLVAENDAKVVGFLAGCIGAYFPNGSRLFRITALVAAGTRRGTGVGRTLVERAIELAASRGCTGVELTTGEQRAGAHAFYERLGFKRTSLRYLRRL
jgi:ribosomal protein S18 acetylase RimI-like enzyme